MLVTSTFPPPHVSGVFDDDNPPPAYYRGIEFPIELLDELIKVEGEDKVVILDTMLAAHDIQVHVIDEGILHPFYCVLNGTRHHYVICAWSDRVEIEVCDPRTHEATSVDFPVTEDQLRRALADIVADCR